VWGRRLPYKRTKNSRANMIIASHDLVVVRLGHFKRANEGDKSLKKALGLLMETVPPSK
jgi:hypothetical protein